ncbi:MAG: MbcA/ParS/Xre antitoxin family protein [Acidobacteriota bacterium]
MSAWTRPEPAPKPSVAADGAVVSKAALRAAQRLGVSNRALSRIIGLSEASISRMGSGRYTLSPADKPFELAVLFIRLFRALDAVVAGDEAAARRWLESDNLALGGAPVVLMQSLAGLIDVVAYLDSRRAVV